VPKDDALCTFGQGGDGRVQRTVGDRVRDLGLRGCCGAGCLKGSSPGWLIPRGGILAERRPLLVGADDVPPIGFAQKGESSSGSMLLWTTAAA
jgi:hypothetical protein